MRAARSAAVSPPSKGADVTVRSIVPSAETKRNENVSPGEGTPGGVVPATKPSSVAVIEAVKGPVKSTRTWEGGAGVVEPALPAVLPAPVAAVSS